MRLSVTRRQRATLLFLSASGFAAWFSGLGEPIGAQDMDDASVTAFRALPQARPLRVASLIVRDPFAGGPVAREPYDGNRKPAAREIGAGGAAVHGSSPSLAEESVVPNIDAAPGDGSGASARTLVVRATIVGQNAVAYVANGTMMDIVRVGDTLADRRIAKIDLHGLVFSDGTRLDLPDAFRATPPSAPAHRAITLGIDDLRRLLAPRPASTAAGRSIDRTAAKPLPTPSTAETPTPGPLPSIDTNGLPVGVNPTSNPSNPTAYPYPYPYAPAAR